MISNKYRFHGHGSLRYVHKNATTVRGSNIVLKFIENKRRKHSRVAVVVSKKVNKSAVGRNRIRRRVYEIIRNKIHDIDESYDLVFIVVSQEIKTIEHATLENMINDILHNSGICKKHQ